MALLTTQEVHMKSFTATKFREGYDPDEVDDFLDEVIWTIGQLQTENTEIKSQLEEAQNKLAAVGKGEVVAPADDSNDERVAKLESDLKAAQVRIVELESQPREQVPVEVVTDDSELQSLRQQLSDANRQLANANQQIEQLQSEAANAASKVDEASAHEAQAAVESGDSQSAASMLALAQRVHDEYVRDGQAEGTRLIEEAKAQGRQLVHEAEQHRDEVVQQMESRRDELQGRVEELKRFETDYRASLRSQLESLLSHVNDEAH